MSLISQKYWQSSSTSVSHSDSAGALNSNSNSDSNSDSGSGSSTFSSVLASFSVSEKAFLLILVIFFIVLAILVLVVIGHNLTLVAVDSEQEEEEEPEEETEEEETDDEEKDDCECDCDFEKEQLSAVSERLSLRSGTVSAAASARFVNSVSDLYAPDEIDALLDEIQVDFEPIQVRQNLVDELCDEGLCSHRLVSSGVGNGRSLTNVNSMSNFERNSVHSWDSHGIYNHTTTMEDSESRHVGGPVSMYCDSTHLKTPIGILRIILLVCCLCSMGCLLSSGTAVYAVFSLPFVARIRLMLFIILWTMLVTLLLLFLDVTLLYTAFPFHYHRVAAGLYAMESAGLIGSSVLIVSLTQIYRISFPWIAKVTRDQLMAAAVFGFISGAIALALTFYACFELCHFHLPKNKREDTDQLTLTERGQAPAQSQIQPQGHGQGQGHQGATPSGHSHGNQKSAVGSKNVPSEPVTTTVVWPIDDVQPCSSKHHNNPNNVGMAVR